MFKNDLDYNDIKKDLQSKNQAHLFQLAVKEKSIKANGTSNHVAEIDFNQYPKFTYDDLIKPSEELPAHVLNESKEVIKF